MGMAYTFGSRGATLYHTASAPGFARSGAGLETQQGFRGAATLPLSFQKKLGGTTAQIGDRGPRPSRHLQASSGRLGAQATRLKPNFSDGALRKSGGTMCGLSSTTRHQPSSTLKA